MIGTSLLHSKDTTALLCWPVLFSVPAAAATIAQAVLLAEVVAHVLVDGASSTGGVWSPLAGPQTGLLGAVVARSGFVWLREVTALRGAAHAKCRVRKRLLDRLLVLGPAYTGGELVTTARDGSSGDRPFVGHPRAAVGAGDRAPQPPPTAAPVIRRAARQDTGDPRPDRFIVMLFKETSLLLAAFASVGLVVCAIAARAGARKRALVAAASCAAALAISLVPVVQATITASA